MKYVICVAKDEDFIKQFCEYYLYQLGFDKIIIGDNGLTETQVKSIDFFLMSGTVELRDWRNAKEFQGTFYRSIRDELGHDDWVAKVDCDEFLDFNGLTITEFVRDFPSDCASIAFNWLMYTSPIACIKNLNQCIAVSDDYWSPYNKCINRYNDINWVVYDEHESIPRSSEYNLYHSNGNLINSKDKTYGTTFVDYSKGHCKHYRIIDFIRSVKKHQRGYPNDANTFNPIEIHKYQREDELLLATYERFELSANQILSYYNEEDNKITSFTQGIYKICNDKFNSFDVYTSIDDFNKLKIIALNQNKQLIYKSLN